MFEILDNTVFVQSSYFVNALLGFDIKTCNLVLGIDEYLSGFERELGSEFIECKKFYQELL